MIFITIIGITFIASTITSLLILNKKNKKWLGMFTAFCIDAFVLSVSAWLIYWTEDEIRRFGGFGSTGLYMLILSIPVITWINFFVLEWVGRKN